jgi:hypothetical protein
VFDGLDQIELLALVPPKPQKLERDDGGAAVGELDRDDIIDQAHVLLEVCNHDLLGHEARLNLRSRGWRRRLSRRICRGACSYLGRRGRYRCRGLRRRKQHRPQREYHRRQHEREQ